MQDLAGLLPFLFIIVALWFLILRPAKAKQRQALSVMRSLAPGQRVMTTAGLFGTITDVDEREVGLEIAPGVVVRYVKQAIATIETTIDSPAETVDLTPPGATPDTVADSSTRDTTAGA